MVGLLRRYSRQPHLWRTAKRVQKILSAASDLPDEGAPDQAVRVHKLEQRLDQTTLRALAADYTAGMTSTELRQKYALGKSSVLKLLVKAGVELRRRGLSQEQVAQVVERYQAGLAIREVAAELRLPKTTVQDTLRNAAVVTRPAARRPGVGKAARVTPR